MKSKTKKVVKKKCLVCNKEMTEVYDDISKRYTGHLWRCENCMKDSPNLIISIG